MVIITIFVNLKLEPAPTSPNKEQNYLYGYELVLFLSSITTV
jgi:hypothetical protein